MPVPLFTRPRIETVLSRVPPSVVPGKDKWVSHRSIKLEGYLET